MNENKRLLAIFGAIIAIVAIILLVSLIPEKDKSFSCGIKPESSYNKLGKTDYEQYQCLIKKKQKNAIVVAKNLSDKKKSALNKVAKRIGKTIYYLDTKNITKKELTKIKKELKYKDKSFDSDVILIIENKKVVSYKENILDNYNELINYTQEEELAKFACGVDGSKEYKNLGELSYKQYQCLLERKQPFALIIARTSCGWCQKYKPVINEFVGKNNYPIYLVDYDKWQEDDFNSLIASLEYFKENESWGTPLTLAIQNKKVISELSGYTDSEEELDKFFEEAKIK